jgi:hypothetical protein
METPMMTLITNYNIGKKHQRAAARIRVSVGINT